MQHNPTGNGHPTERTSWLNKSLHNGIIWALRTAIPATQRKWKEWSTLKLNREPRLMDVDLLKRARNGDLNAANDAGAAIWKDQKSGARLDAEQWFRRAAEGGHLLGMTNLATLLRETGRNEEAARWDLATAGSGDAQAMYNRAVCYQNGNGVPIDVNEALSWYRKAAAKGFRDAQFNLGQILLYGQITPANVPEAAHWFKLAAEQEDPQEMFLLGGILAGIFGDAVPPRSARSSALDHPRRRKELYSCLFQCSSILRSGDGHCARPESRNSFLPPRCPPRRCKRKP